MSKAFDSIKAGLEQAKTHAEGNNSQVLIHKIEPVDVKAIRERTNMTQREFAASFGISLGTLRHWEQGKRQPRGPARVLLRVLAKEPAAVINAIKQ